MARTQASSDNFGTYSVDLDMDVILQVYIPDYYQLLNAKIGDVAGSIIGVKTVNLSITTKI